MKRLAHDLNTLTRVYMAVGSLRSEIQDTMVYAQDEDDVRWVTAKVTVLGVVQDMINHMIDENYADIDDRGFNGFEREADETSSVAFEDLDDLPF